MSWPEAIASVAACLAVAHILGGPLIVIRRSCKDCK